MPAIKSSLPLAPEDTSWDAGEAIKAVKAYASDSEGNIDFSKYKKAFFYCEEGESDKQGDYHLPFADVIGGELKAVWDGVAAAMAALNGARGGDPVPEADRESVYGAIGSYYRKFEKEQPDLSKSEEPDSKKAVGDRFEGMLSIDHSETKDMGDGMFTCTVTTSEVDRTGQSIDTQGITTETYMQNPVVMYGHDYSSLPIGKTVSLKQYKNKMVATFQLAVKEYPFAQTVASLIKGGYLSAVSIGGVIKSVNEDWSVIKAMEMVEFSVVPVPANASALITGRSLEAITGKTVEVIQSEYRDFVNKAMEQKLSSVDSKEIATYIDTIEKLLAILKANAKDEAGSQPEREVIRLTARKAANEIARTSETIIRFIKAKE